MSSSDALKLLLVLRAPSPGVLQESAALLAGLCSTEFVLALLLSISERSAEDLHVFVALETALLVGESSRECKPCLVLQELLTVTCFVSDEAASEAPWLFQLIVSASSSLLLSASSEVFITMLLLEITVSALLLGAASPVLSVSDNFRALLLTEISKGVG